MEESWQQTKTILIEKIGEFIQDQQKLRRVQRCRLGISSSYEAQLQLSQLYQVTSVLNYQMEFEKLMWKATELSEIILISFFLSGLKPEIRQEMSFNRPTSMNEAFTSARFHESRLEAINVAVDKFDEKLAGSTLKTIMVEDIASIPEVKSNMIAVDSLIQFDAMKRGKGEEKYMKSEVEVQVSVAQETYKGLNDLEDSINPVNQPPTCLEVHDFKDAAVLVLWKSRHQQSAKGLSSQQEQSTMFVDVLFSVNLLWPRRAQEMGFYLVLMKELHTVAGVCVFKIYSLKEVYQEIPKLHLEDKVVLKEVVVDFTATWCGPCRFIYPVLVEIAKNSPHVIFLKVDVDELKTVAEEFKVHAMPTFVFLKEGKEVDRLVGAKKEDLQAKVTQHGTVVA